MLLACGLLYWKLFCDCISICLLAGSTEDFGVMSHFQQFFCQFNLLQSRLGRLVRDVEKQFGKQFRVDPAVPILSCSDSFV